MWMSECTYTEPYDPDDRDDVNNKTHVTAFTVFRQQQRLGHIHIKLSLSSKKGLIKYPLLLMLFSVRIITLPTLLNMSVQFSSLYTTNCFIIL